MVRLQRNSSALGPKGPKHNILRTSLTQKMLQSSDSMYSFIFLLETRWYYKFTWSGLNSQEIVIFVPVMSSQWLKLIRNKTQFLMKSVHWPSGRIELYVFQQENRGAHRICAFWHFPRNTGCQKLHFGPGNWFYVCVLKSGFHLPKIFFFISIYIGLQKWWKRLFISS